VLLGQECEIELQRVQILDVVPREVGVAIVGLGPWADALLDEGAQRPHDLTLLVRERLALDDSLEDAVGHTRMP
jgi:hypothetical protein